MPLVAHCREDAGSPAGVGVNDSVITIESPDKATHMNSNSNTGGKNVLASDTSALQALKHVTWSGPRRLTASEIVLLRQSKGEVSRRVRQLLRETTAAPPSER